MLRCYSNNDLGRGMEQPEKQEKHQKPCLVARELAKTRLHSVSRSSSAPRALFGDLHQGQHRPRRLRCWILSKGALRGAPPRKNLFAAGQPHAPHALAVIARKGTPSSGRSTAATRWPPEGNSSRGESAPLTTRRQRWACKERGPPAFSSPALPPLR